MAHFSVKLQHSEKTFEALAHKQYDLFCTGNRTVRTALFVAAVLIGVINYSQWWGILAIAYGCFLITSTYSAANHIAHKLVKNLEDSGMSFPCSRYIFEEKAMLIQPLSPSGEEDGTPEELPYSKIIRLGEDSGYFYIFPNEFGGYMISKEELSDDCGKFKSFIEKKTSLHVQKRTTPVKAIYNRIKERFGK